ncbi:MAG TPA: hypothetical protein VN915_05235 [Elusimicrobiota bacterium]|nr:hypothetical protein [Elusimicrobiota bacterium]
MTFLTLRWLFLALALASAGACFLFGLTPERAAAAAACAALWVLLSRRKARSLDREVLGVPPRA